MLSSVSERQWSWMGSFFIGFAVLVAYLNSFQVPFLFDDIDSILNNWSLRSLSDFSWIQPPPDGPLGGRPVANATYAINYSLGAGNVFGYHLVNFAIHCFAALILFFLLREVFVEKRQKEWIRKESNALAFFCALIWAVNPVQTISVTYISQRTECLMGLCYLLVIYTYFRSLRSSHGQRWLRLSVILCLAGMGCKEGMATAPIMVLLFDRTYHSSTFLEALKTRRVFYIGLFSSWVFLLCLWLGTEDRGVSLNWGVHWYQYALTESRVIFQYAKVIVYPRSLVFDYFLQPYLRYTLEIPFTVALLSAVGTAIYLFYRRVGVGLALLWFLLILAPSSSVLPVALQPMGENRVYLPSLGIEVIIVLGLYHLSRRWSPVILMGLVYILIYASIERNADFSSSVRIWSDTVQKIPDNSRAFDNLGIVLMSEGRFVEAGVAFDLSIARKQDWPDPLTHKGNIAYQQGNFPQAEFWLREALKKAPNGKAELANLALLLNQTGSAGEAELLIAKALRLYPHYALAWSVEGDIDLSKGKVEDAIEDYRKAVSLSPHIAAFHNNLGGVLLRIGKDDEAYEQFVTAVRLKSNLAKAQSNLATMLARAGDYSKAILHYVYALQYDKNDSEARVNLGLAYQKTGRLVAAAGCYREALRRDPRYARAKTLLNDLDVNSHLSSPPDAVR